MTKGLSRRDRDLLERFLDGTTSAEESRACEERLTSDEAFKDAYGELRALRDLLKSGERLEHDPVFWSKLSGRLESRLEADHNLLPFPQKYLPLAASAFALLVLVSFSYIFSNRLSFFRFWETGSEAVRSAYESTLAEGSFIPLFSGLDNDKTLQFALYGSLPLDESGGTVLNVDDRSSEGYRIEVQKEQPRKQKKVTMADFVAEVRPTNVQKAVIESLLTESRRELEGAVLVGHNDAVAINADLSKLNRAMVSGIVSVLGQEQRSRLNRLLTREDAAYEYSARTRIPRPDKNPTRVDVPRPKNTFVVFSPDSIGLRSITFDMEQAQKEMHVSLVRFKEVQALRQKTIQWLINEPVIAGGNPPDAAGRVSLRSRKDRLTIHVMTDTTDMDLFMFETEGGGFGLRGGDSLASFEFRIGGTLQPVPDVRVTSPMVAPAPRPDTAKPRKPFKLDIN